MENMFKLSAVELSGLIKNKQLSVRQVVEAYLENIERLDSKLNCFNAVCREKALCDAERVQRDIDSGALIGRLAGVPIAVKDNICTRGVPTTCSSRMLESFVPAYNASVIDRIEKSGMIVLGKTNMDEFAMGSTTETSCFSAVHNPWNLSRTSGGSSGGSAAAVAGGLAPVALGTDTGGSIRLPCSYCSLTGLKPTYSSVSRYGLIAYASSFDQIGPMARSVDDCSALFEIISSPDSRDSTCVGSKGFSFANACRGSVEGKTLGIPREYLDSSLSKEVKSSFEYAVEIFEKLGARTDIFSMPVLNYAVSTYYIIACAQASSNLARYDGIRYGFRASGCDSIEQLYTESRTEGFGIEAKRRIMIGSYVLSEGYYDDYYKKALKARQLIKEEFSSALQRFDFILSPVAADTAPELNSSLDPLTLYLADKYTVCANLTGLPAVSLPCGFDGKGLPTGIQLTGREFCEEDLLSAAKAFESATDFHLAHSLVFKEAMKP